MGDNKENSTKVAWRFDAAMTCYLKGYEHDAITTTSDALHWGRVLADAGIVGQIVTNLNADIVAFEALRKWKPPTDWPDTVRKVMLEEVRTQRERWQINSGWSCLEADRGHEAHRRFAAAVSSGEQQ